MKVRFVILLTLCIACLYSCKKDPNKKLLKDYTHKLAGTHTWKGYIRMSVPVIDTPEDSRDSIAQITESFEIKVINIENISIQGLILERSDINTTTGIITFTRAGQGPYSRLDDIYFYYKYDSIKYITQQGNLLGYSYKEIHTHL